jgi:PKD repeat protein
MKKILFLFSLALILFPFSNSKASHIVGSDITYKCTATAGIYEITMVIYRNCDGGIELCPSTCGAPCTQTMNIQGADPGCSSSTFGSISLTLQNVMDVQDNICPSVKNTCTNTNCVTPGTFSPGIEKYTFKGLANVGPTSGIPASCCKVRFSWELCCRNAQIATGAAGANFYTDVVLNRCLVTSPCNNGPVPINDPLFVTPGGENVQFNLGMFDAEGDSITYAFAPALQGFNSPVSYDPPWAYNKPMPWAGAWDGLFPAGIRIGAQDGMMRFTPQNASGSYFYGVIAIEAKEWRTINGVPTLLSITRRDAQCVVLNNTAPNNTPRIKTIPMPPSGGILKKDWVACAGSQICFTIIATDVDTIDTARLTFNFPPLMNGVTVTNLAPNPLQEDSVKLCWTPDESRVNSYPYYFTVKARDNFCPVDGKNHQVFSIKVTSSHLIDSISKTVSTCNKWNLSYNLLPGKPLPYRSKWRISKTPNDYSMSGIDSFINVSNIPNQLFSDTGKYLVELTLTGDSSNPTCVDVRYDTVVVNTPKTTVLVNDTSVCKFSTVTLQSTVKHTTGSVNYSWMNFGNSSSIGSSSTLPVTTGTTLKKIVLKVTDSLSCTAYDTISVSSKPMPTLSFDIPGGLFKCMNSNPFTFINTSVDTNIAGCVYAWKINDTTVVYSDTLVHPILTVGNSIIKLMVTTPDGCTDSLAKMIAVNASPTADFMINNDSQCFKGNAFLFTNTSAIVPSSALTYQWNFGNSTTSTTTNPPLRNYATAGNYTVRLIASSVNACRDTVMKQIIVHPQPTLSFTLNTLSQCLNGNSFTATNTTPGSLDPSLLFTWKSELSSDSTATFTKTYGTSGTKNIQLNILTADGCEDSLIKTVTVFPSPLASFTISDSIQCFKGNNFVFTNTSGAGNSVLWDIDGQTYTSQNVTKTFATSTAKQLHKQ